MKKSIQEIYEASTSSTASKKNNKQSQSKEVSNVTFYEIRSLITHIAKDVSRKDTKAILDDILKTLERLEVSNKPVPTIAKLKTTSKSILS
jgi:hypothetical protein